MPSAFEQLAFARQVLEFTIYPTINRYLVFSSSALGSEHGSFAEETCSLLSTQDHHPSCASVARKDGSHAAFPEKIWLNVVNAHQYQRRLRWYIAATAKAR